MKARLKRWRRILTRYVKQPKSTATQIRQWFSAPAAASTHRPQPG